jgi:hypothetical protein
MDEPGRGGVLTCEPPWVDPDPAATRAALARLRAYRRTLPPPRPDHPFRVPDAAYGGPAPGGRWRPMPTPALPAGADAGDPLDRPSPEPWNGGLTPGWPPDAPPAGGADPAVVLGLAAATEAAVKAAAAARWASRENWELARWLADVEAGLDAAGYEREGGCGRPADRAAGAPSPPVEGG